jgi:hypothetical protein
MRRSKAVEDTLLGRRVAIKMVHGRRNTEDLHFRARFLPVLRLVLAQPGVPAQDSAKARHSEGSKNPPGNALNERAWLNRNLL